MISIIQVGILIFQNNFFIVDIFNHTSFGQILQYPKEKLVDLKKLNIFWLFKVHRLIFFKKLSKMTFLTHFIPINIRNTFYKYYYNILVCNIFLISSNWWFPKYTMFILCLNKESM